MCFRIVPICLRLVHFDTSSNPRSKEINNEEPPHLIPLAEADPPGLPGTTTPLWGGGRGGHRDPFRGQGSCFLESKLEGCSE